MSSCISSFWVWLRRGEWVALSCRWKASGSTFGRRTRRRYAGPARSAGTLLLVYDHSEDRAWRNLDSCQFKTYLHAALPRIKSPTHGTQPVKLPWAEADSRFTLLLERLAIDLLKEATVRGATRILRNSWDETWHLMQRAV